MKTAPSKVSQLGLIRLFRFVFRLIERDDQFPTRRAGHRLAGRRPDRGFGLWVDRKRGERIVGFGAGERSTRVRGYRLAKALEPVAKSDADVGHCVWIWCVANGV
jgi:hypothetical protein